MKSIVSAKITDCEAASAVRVKCVPTHLASLYRFPYPTFYYAPGALVCLFMV